MVFDNDNLKLQIQSFLVKKVVEDKKRKKVRKKKKKFGRFFFFFFFVFAFKVIYEIEV